MAMMMDRYQSIVLVEEINLHMHRLLSRYRIQEREFHSSQIRAEAYLNSKFAELVLEVSRLIPGMPAEEYVFRAPADWWQAVKERWFPKGWLRRWPVKYREDTIETQVIFPNYKVPAELGVYTQELRIIRVNAEVQQPRKKPPSPPWTDSRGDPSHGATSRT